MIQAHGSEAVKIGYATDVRQRLGELQAGNHLELRLLVAIPMSHWPTEPWPAKPISVERGLHHRFARLRIRPDGEWFRLAGPIRRWIATLPEAVLAPGFRP